MANVLIVDDDPDLRITLEHILVDEQHSVHTACDGTDALSFLRADGTSSACYVVVLDIFMPIMDGVEFLEEAIRDERVWPRIRCLVMSGNLLATDRHARISTRIPIGTPILHKPFGIYEFLDMLEEVIEEVIATLPLSS